MISSIVNTYIWVTNEREALAALKFYRSKGAKWSNGDPIKDKLPISLDLPSGISREAQGLYFNFDPERDYVVLPYTEITQKQLALNEFFNN